MLTGEHSRLRLLQLVVAALAILGCALPTTQAATEVCAGKNPSECHAAVECQCAQGYEGCSVCQACPGSCTDIVCSDHEGCSPDRTGDVRFCSKPREIFGEPAEKRCTPCYKCGSLLEPFDDVCPAKCGETSPRPSPSPTQAAPEASPSPPPTQAAPETPPSPAPTLAVGEVCAGKNPSECHATVECQCAQGYEGCSVCQACPGSCTDIVCSEHEGCPPDRTGDVRFCSKPREIFGEPAEKRCTPCYKCGYPGPASLLEPFDDVCPAKCDGGVPDTGTKGPRPKPKPTTNRGSVALAECKSETDRTSCKKVLGPNFGRKACVWRKKKGCANNKKFVDNPERVGCTSETDRKSCKKHLGPNGGRKACVWSTKKGCRDSKKFVDNEGRR